MNTDAKILNKIFSKPNPTVHKKDHMPRTSWIYSRVAMVVQYSQINQCDTPNNIRKDF